MEIVALRWVWFWLSIGWMMMGVVVILSLIPPPAIHESVPHGDKYTHLLAYFCLMAWFAQIYHTVWPRLGYAVGLIAMGAGIEALQSLTAYRQADSLDILVNSLGIFSAWLLIRGRLAKVLTHLENFLITRFSR